MRARLPHVLIVCENDGSTLKRFMYRREIEAVFVPFDCTKVCKVKHWVVDLFISYSPSV